jgi:hypothetical protein
MKTHFVPWPYDPHPSWALLIIYHEDATLDVNHQSGRYYENKIIIKLHILHIFKTMH